MIRLPDGYGIVADDRQYIFGKTGTTKTVKTVNGVKVEALVDSIQSQTASYHNSVASCLQKMLGIKQRELVADNELSLPEALRKFEMLQNQFEKLLKEVGKESLV